MELKKHYKMYKSGKQLVVAAVATVAAGVMFAGNQSASADSWQAKSVDKVSAELQQAGTYQTTQSKTVIQCGLWQRH